jgi:hypothetical protein
VFAQVLGNLERISQQLDPRTLEASRAVALFDDAGPRRAAVQRDQGSSGAPGRGDKGLAQSGHRSAAHWVAEATGETVGAAARTLQTARALEQLPDTDEAFRSGRLSEVQAAEVAGAASADPHTEAELLEAASSTSVKGLRDRCRQVRAGAESDDQAWARRCT